MALLYFDGFETYSDTQIDQIWDDNSGSGITIGAPPVSRSDNAIELNGNGSYLDLALQDRDTYIFGFAILREVIDADQDSFLLLDDSDNTQAGIRFESDGTLSVLRDTTVLGTSSESMTANTWHYVELKIKVDDASGTYDLRLDGVSVVSGSGDTQGQSSDTVQTVRFINTPDRDFWIDDLYVADTTESNNDFLGDVTIKALVPSSDGSETDWTPSSGSNYENVDETTNDGDTSYNSTITLSDRDLYTPNTLSGVDGGKVFGIQTKNFARKEETGDSTIKSIIKTPATDYGGPYRSITTNYKGYVKIWDKNPDTNTQWIVSEINNIEFGASFENPCAFNEEFDGGFC